MTQDWNARLSRAHADAMRNQGAKVRGIRLPAEGSMSVSGDGDLAVIHLRSDAVTLNMQDNAAAFEGWCLALRRWCGVSVTLSWEEPVASEDPIKDVVGRRHYERFLYRIERFRSLFPDWFSIGDDTLLRSSKVLDAEFGSLTLNVAGGRLKKQPTKPWPSDRRWTEDEVECWFVDADNHALNLRYGMSERTIKDQQVPVGLFSEQKPSAGSAIFPGGKGAVDLVCLDDRHLWLLELKGSGNVSVGTLSELLFYTSVLRDAVGGRFRFADAVGGRGRITPSMMQDVEQITGLMLGPALHPLLNDAALFEMLNKAAAVRWHVAGYPTVAFRADVFEPSWPCL